MHSAHHYQAIGRTVSPLWLLLALGCVGAGCATDAEEPSSSLASVECGAEQEPTEPPLSPKPTIKEVRAAGRCKVDATIAPDGQSVKIALRDFSAATTAYLVDRADCFVSLDVDTPAGQSFSLSELTADGSLSLDEGVTAAISASYSFTGLADSGLAVQTFTGPEKKDVHFATAFSEHALSYSPCGTNRDLELAFALSLRSPNATKTGRIDLTTTGPITLAIRPCN